MQVIEDLGSRDDGRSRVRRITEPSTGMSNPPGGDERCRSPDRGWWGQNCDARASIGDADGLAALDAPEHR
jgi:hypothetical protein